MKTCGKYKTNFDTKPEVIDFKRFEDSVRTYYNHKDTIIDTIKVTTKVPFIVEKPYFIQYDGMELSDTNIFHMHEYKYAKKDSLLEYEILVLSTEQPFEVNIDYKLLSKTYKDSTYVRDSLYVKEVEKVRVNQIYVGGSAIVYPGLKGVFIGADFVSKKGWMLGLEAGILNETSLAGKVEFKKLISFRRAKRN